MAIQVPKHRFTVDEYYRMAKAGILDEDSRVELIEGQIVDTPPIGAGHADAVDEFAEVFVLRFSDVARVRSQNPIRLDTYNEPQPDVALLRRPAERYRTTHPTPEDVLLMVQVADSTLAEDRAVKMPLYARFGIREAWLVDIPHSVVHVYRDPAPDGYGVVQTLRRGDRVAPLAFPERELEIAELLR